MHGKGLISIWFFIGVLLLVYGVLILGAGVVSNSSSPPEHPVVLARSARRHLVGRGAPADWR